MKCSSTPVLSYSKFSQLIHKKAAKKRIPIGGGLELTFRCNLKCVHCYAITEFKRAMPELSFREICQILDQLADEGCLWLLITGGEPLIRKDFLDIYMYAKRKGFVITLFTNGTLLTEDIINCFRRWRPFNIEITLYGATESTYEKVTQRSKSFIQCLKGIELLLEANLPIRLKSIIMTLNKHEIRELKEFSKSRSMPFLFDPILSPCLDGSQSPALYRLSPEEVLELDIADPERFQQWKDYLRDFRGSPASSHLYQCGAGETSFFINPYGELQLCVLSRTPSYDLRTGTFKEGWQQFLKKIRCQKVRKEFRCRKCELISLCGQCPGWSYLEHGNHDTPVDYLCKIAHLRAAAINRSA